MAKRLSRSERAARRRAGALALKVPTTMRVSKATEKHSFSRLNVKAGPVTTKQMTPEELKEFQVKIKSKHY